MQSAEARDGFGERPSTNPKEDGTPYAACVVFAVLLNLHPPQTTSARTHTHTLDITRYGIVRSNDHPNERIFRRTAVIISEATTTLATVENRRWFHFARARREPRATEVYSTIMVCA